MRAVVLTTETDPRADRVLAAALARRLGRPIDLHVDLLHATPGEGGVEAAQIARAASAATGSEADDRRAVADLAQIAGVGPGEIRVDAASRRLTVAAAALPGLEARGYRAIEARARRALAGWTVEIAPPADIAPPALRVKGGIVDDAALGAAAWATARPDRVLVLSGGIAGQRASVAAAITARGGGGRADPGKTGGSLKLVWDRTPA